MHRLLGLERAYWIAVRPARGGAVMCFAIAVPLKVVVGCHGPVATLHGIHLVPSNASYMEQVGRSSSTLSTIIFASWPNA